MVETALPQHFGLAIALCALTAGGYSNGASPGGSFSLCLTDTSIVIKDEVRKKVHSAATDQYPGRVRALR